MLQTWKVRLVLESGTNGSFYFLTKLTLLSRMLGSVWHVTCPCPSSIIAGSASKSEKVSNFIKPKMQRGAPINLKKNLYFWNHHGVSFRLVRFACFGPSDRLQRTVSGD